jgi:hypothetical protein
VIPPKAAVAGMKMRLKLDEGDVDGKPVAAVPAEEGAAVTVDGMRVATTARGEEGAAVAMDGVEATDASEFEASVTVAEIADIARPKTDQRRQKRGQRNGSITEGM